MLKAKTKKAIKIMAVNQSAENKIKTVAGLTEALAYITNPAKIYEVSRINCSGSNSNTLEQFRLLRLAFNQNKGIIAHHFIQSFSPNDNITPETVHRFGVEYVKQCFPNYQVVVSTHIDKEHLHNHIIVNSCNMITGKKFYDNKESMKNNRDISDKLCRKYGVSVISTQSEFKPIDQTTMQLALKQKSWKIQLLSDLDDAKEKCRSKSEFISFFKSRNYSLCVKIAEGYSKDVPTTEEIYRSIISENKELFDISDNRVAQTLAYMMVEADTKDCLYFVPSKELRKNKCCIGESGEESTSL